MRALRWAGRTVRLLGIKGYNSAEGGDAIFSEVESLRPGVVLMESFAAGGEDVASGGAVPYRKILPASGLAKAVENVGLPKFREKWTAEAVAVLSALRVGAEVRFGDRLHPTSFDRLVERCSLNDLRHSLALALEAAAGELEKQLRENGPPVKLSNLPQNFVCPMFQELSAERHSLMAHFARLAAEEGHSVAVVVGVEHLDGLEGRFSEARTDVEELLQGGAPQAESDAEWEKELEKRCAIAAFLTSTGTFPPEVVLPHQEQLLPAAKELAMKFYPKYRGPFQERMMRARVDVLEGQHQQLYSALNQATAPRLSGLPELRELCVQISGGVGSAEAFPPTPPPPPGRK